jgi:hypothetical protein
MSVMNRRNAVFGWLAWAIAKEALRSKSRHVVPKNGSSTRRKVVVPAAIAAAVGGAVLFWKRQQDNGDDLAKH